MKKKIQCIMMLILGWVSVVSASTVTYTACPLNKQLYPRDLANNLAILTVSGNVTGTDSSAMIVRIWRDGAVYSETQQTLVFSSNVAPFSLSPTIEAVLKNYTVDIILVQGGETLARQVTDVVAGDAFIINGQSNADAAVETGSASPSVNEHTFIRTFGINWDAAAQTAADLAWKQAKGEGSLWNTQGAIGQWGLRMARLLVEENNIPVVILNGARGAMAIDHFQRNDANHTDLDTNYGRMFARTIWAGINNHVRAVLWYQGESDLGDGVTHEAGFLALYNDWKSNYPRLERVYVHQLHVGCGVDKNNVDLRERQRGWPDTYSDIRVMSTNGNDGHEGCHYTYANGHERIGNNMAAFVLADLYGSANTANTTAPNPLHIYFSSPTFDEITIVMRKPTDALGFGADAVRDFVLLGTAATVTSGAVSPTNTIVLTLSGDASSAVGLIYTGHSGDDPSYADGAWVTNAAGVGLLTFSESVYSSTVIVPANPELSSLNSDWITFSWDASPNADVYVIRRDGVQIGVTPSLQYVDTGLAPSTTYQYEVAASNIVGLSSFVGGSVSTLASPTSAPGTPTGLNARLLESSSSVSLTWPAIAHATGYRVRRNGVEIGTTSAYDASFTDTGLMRSNTAYSYDVRAENEIGNSAYSSPTGGFFLDNLVSNGSFETEPAGTAVAIGSTPVVDVSSITDWRVFSIGSPPIDGFSVTSVASASDWGVALRLDMTNTGIGVGADYGFDRYGSTIPVRYGTNYLFSFDAAWISGSARLTLIMVEYDSVGSFLGQQGFAYPLSNANYQKFSLAWTPAYPSTASLYLRFVPTSPAGTSASILLDNVLFSINNSATVILEDLLQTYDGAAKPVSATTIPPGFVVDLAYDGSMNVPTGPGNFTVIGTINDVSYTGSDTNTLVIEMPAGYNDWKILWFTEAQQTNETTSGPEVYYDADDFSNWEEYIADTDPTDGQAMPTFQMQPTAVDGYILSWASVSGRVYSIDWASDLTQGLLPLKENILWPQSSYTDQIHQAETEGFYQMNISLPTVSTNAAITAGDANGVAGDLFQSATITASSAMHPATGGFLATDMFSSGAPVHSEDAIFAD